VSLYICWFPANSHSTTHILTIPAYFHIIQRKLLTGAFPGPGQDWVKKKMVLEERAQRQVWASFLPFIHVWNTQWFRILQNWVTDLNSFEERIEEDEDKSQNLFMEVTSFF